MPKPTEVETRHCTAVSMTVTDHGVRLAFGESVGEGQENYYSAIHLPHDVAAQFRRLFDEMMAKHADRIMKEMPEKRASKRKRTN